MNILEATKFYQHLSLNEQSEFLALFSHELTVLARESYEIGTDNIINPKFIREINEIQHLLSMQIALLLKDDSERYPDDVLMRIIFENREITNLNRTFSRVIGHFDLALA